MNGEPPSDQEDQPAVPPPMRPSRSGYPLTALAVLITALATLLACVDPDRWREQYAWMQAGWPWRPVGLFGGAALLGGLIGFCHLFASGFNRRSIFLAPGAGILAGELGLLILIAPGPIWRTIFAIGCLLTAAILLRLGAE